MINRVFNHYFMGFFSSSLSPTPVSIVFFRALCACYEERGRRNPGRSSRVGIFKLLRSSGIDFKESIPPSCVAWRAGTTTLFLLGS
jgi:hypothetical protein